MKKKINLNLIVVLLLVIFFSGFFVLLNGDISIKNKGMDEIQFFKNIGEGFDASGGKIKDTDDCPQLLVKRGGKILLYNNNNKLGTAPVEFTDLNEYSTYLDKQREKGINCPVLFLQQETDAQNNDVYRIRQSPFYIEGGLPAIPIEVHDNKKPIEILDATRDNGYNTGMYPGFDPYNLHTGRYSKLDVIHDSTEKTPGGSVNPADPNWLGVISTQKAVDSGMFKENEVGKVIYPKMIPTTQ